MSKNLDELLREGDALFKNSIASLLSNLGKTVAAITLIITCIVTFTDITIGGISAKDYFSMLSVLVMSAYIIYFSLLDVGEKKGEDSEEYRSAKERYSATRVKICGYMLPKLRAFCEEYSRCELEYRKRYRLLSYGLAPEDKNAPEGIDRRRGKIFKRIERMRLYPITARVLLSCERKSDKGEFSNPERGRFFRSFLKLLPSVICMCITVSVVLSVKDGMSAADVINSILKLSALPIIGIRGYTAGIFYSSVTKSAWLETKNRILESFLQENENNGEIADLKTA